MKLSKKLSQLCYLLDKLPTSKELKEIIISASKLYTALVEAEKLFETSSQCWLIERCRNKRYEWLGVDPIKTYYFTTNANDALRFARKVDAESFCDFVGLEEETIITSHLFNMDDSVMFPHVLREKDE